MRAVVFGLAALGLAALSLSIGTTAMPARAQTAPWLQAPPNKTDAVPAIKGQTRAPPLTTGLAKLNVQTVASGIPHPWAIAFLPG